MSADNFQPNLTLREEPLKRALKSYLVAPILSKYIVCSVRVLWRESDNDLNDLYEKRRKLEGELERLKEVSLFIDCITNSNEKFKWRNKDRFCVLGGL